MFLNTSYNLLAIAVDNKKKYLKYLLELNHAMPNWVQINTSLVSLALK
jgi:hypothetical protein